MLNQTIDQVSGRIKKFSDRQNLKKFTCCAPFLMKGDFALPKQERKPKKKTLDTGNRKSNTEERGKEDPRMLVKEEPSVAAEGSHCRLEQVRRHWERPLQEEDMDGTSTASEQLVGKFRQL